MKLHNIVFMARFSLRMEHQICLSQYTVGALDFERAVKGSILTAGKRLSMKILM